MLSINTQIYKVNTRILMTNIIFCDLGHIRKNERKWVAMIIKKTDQNLIGFFNY